MADNNQDVGAVQRSQEFYRLKQTVQSAGEIYEINESAKAIYIGPDSDISEVQITYFNPDEPNALETAVVSVNGPLVGRVDSLPITVVPSTGQPARILASAVDIVDNAYVPPGSTALRRFNIPSVIDLMFALKGLPAIPEVRADRTLRFPQVPYEKGIVPASDGETLLIVPIYGRRLITVTVVAVADLNVSLALVNLMPGGPTVPRGLGTFNIPGTIPVSRTAKAAVIRASDAARQGTNWDLVGTATSFFSENDQPPDPGGPIGGSFVSSPRGMADLLVITLTDNLGGGVLTLFADVFIKLADRET